MIYNYFHCWSSIFFAAVFCFNRFLIIYCSYNHKVQWSIWDHKGTLMRFWVLMVYFKALRRCFVLQWWYRSCYSHNYLNCTEQFTFTKSNFRIQVSPILNFSCLIFGKFLCASVLDKLCNSVSRCHLFLVYLLRNCWKINEISLHGLGGVSIAIAAVCKF